MGSEAKDNRVRTVRKHTVSSDECINRLAARHGLDPQTIWDHPNNRSLRVRRGENPILRAGDRVYLPAIRTNSSSVCIGRRYRFRRRGLRATSTLKLIENGLPRAGISYTLDFGSYQVTGRTDTQGRVRYWPPCQVKRAALIIDDGEEFEIVFAEDDVINGPDDTVTRLKNLGYLKPMLVGDPEALLHALARFQADYDLKPTGQIDEMTRYKLKLVHGS